MDGLEAEPCRRCGWYYKLSIWIGVELECHPLIERVVKRLSRCGIGRFHRVILIEVTQLRRLRPVQRHARHRRGRPDRRAALDNPLNRAVRWRPRATQAEEVNPPARGCFAG